MNVIEGFKCWINASEFVVLSNRLDIRTFILQLHNYVAPNLAGGNASPALRDGFQNKFSDYENHEEQYH